MGEVHSLNGRLGEHSVDAADLADRIRRLAVDAYRSLKRHDAALDELTELLRRIDELRQATQDPHLTQIDHWLRSARHFIERRKRLCTSEFPKQGTDHLSCFRLLSQPLAS
jgi:hypothetical protein